MPPEDKGATKGAGKSYFVENFKLISSLIISILLITPVFIVVVILGFIITVIEGFFGELGQ